VLLALTRAVSPAFDRCELTYLPRVPIDVAVARVQHAAYGRALEALGCVVRELPSGDRMPDAVFIEDVAVVLDEIAIVTRPGAESRRVETAAVAEALSSLRRLIFIESPATVDGGDVLIVGRTIYIGCSGRTNAEGVEQVRQAAAPHGYDVRPVRVSGCLHLKSAATALDDETLIVNPKRVPPDAFERVDRIDVHPEEPGAANVVRAGGKILAASAFPRTRERLERRGFDVVTVDLSELAKAEGAVTCCSLIVAEAVS
jgi:dimethylargininase